MSETQSRSEMVEEAKLHTITFRCGGCMGKAIIVTSRQSRVRVLHAIDCHIRSEFVRRHPVFTFSGA